MSKKRLRFKKRRSLRTILIIWFIVFSIVPLAFLGWYSLFNFEKALDQELIQRLQANVREVSIIFNDYYNALSESRDGYVKNPHLIYNLSISDGQALSEIAAQWIKNHIMSSVVFYDREGRLIGSVYKDEKNNIRSLLPSLNKVLLNENYLSHLSDKSSLGLVDYQQKQTVSLILFSKVLSIKGKNIGYIEQTIDLKDSFLQKIRNKLKVDFFVMRESGEIAISSNPIFKKLQKNFYSDVVGLKGKDRFLTVNLDQQPFGITIDTIHWGRSNFYLAATTVKKDTRSLISNLNFTFLSVMAIVVFFLVITIIISTNLLLKPINELISGLKTFDKSENLVQLPINNHTEIGVLTNAFNEMSYKIYQGKKDLRNKITELEDANKEIKDTQSKLVHSAKMTSLGQLVAGVAHELNNPIGFIYSNTSHLKDYSEKLFRLIEQIEKEPSKIKQIKDQMDYDYIKKDLPRLIKSCQDGAQRTRDIVLGLRNFSRLDEAQLKEIDLCDAIDNTLELLKGEIKNRIQVHRQYEPIPKVQCYASQINQVLMNILSNSVQAVQGAGQIWITTTAFKASGSKPGRVQVSIQDSGVGMEDGAMQKIFEPFYTTKGVGQGTGLGLSISYGIIENHGGEIQVRSQKDVGTEFIITIPVTQPRSK